MIIDCVTFNGEYDLFNLRYNILKDYVDEFVVCEFRTTFSGKEKPRYSRTEMADTYPKATFKYRINNIFTPQETALAESSPNTQGAEHWKLEFLQKESLKLALTHLSDDDVVYIGDCDEIWDPKVEPNISPSKLQLKVYTYYLNLRSSEQFRGTLVARYKDIKDNCLNHLRSDTKETQEGGWHFTSMGGYDEVKRKLSDSYTRDSYWTSWVEDNLEENIKAKKDFLGRGFQYTVDETEWPQYLKDNREKYTHLCLQT